MNRLIVSLTISFAVIASWSSISVRANSEGDALSAFRRSLNDPDKVLQSWDPNLVNPCTWFHITCNQDNRVTRVYVSFAHFIFLFSRVVWFLSLLPDLCAVGFHELDLHFSRISEITDGIRGIWIELVVCIRFSTKLFSSYIGRTF